MKFTTWEQAAQWAAYGVARIDQSRQCYEPGDDSVSNMEGEFNDEDWKSVADYATAGLMFAQGWDFNEEFGMLATDDILKLLARKQHDYGHDNILRHGIEGVKVRVWDKIARLKNLQAKGAEARNESLLDTWTDIIGYSIIAIMLEHGVFELPLEADVKTKPPVKRELVWTMKGSDSGVRWPYDKGSVTAALKVRRLLSREGAVAVTIQFVGGLVGTWTLEEVDA